MQDQALNAFPIYLVPSWERARSQTDKKYGLLLFQSYGPLIVCLRGNSLSLILHPDNNNIFLRRQSSARLCNTIFQYFYFHQLFFTPKYFLFRKPQNHDMQFLAKIFSLSSVYKHAINNDIVIPPPPPGAILI